MTKQLIRSAVCLFFLFSCCYKVNNAEDIKKLNELGEENTKDQSLSYTKLMLFIHRQAKVLQEITAVKSEITKLTDLILDEIPLDCSAASKRGDWKLVTKIKPPGLSPRFVRCEQFTEGGGWTVVVHRSAHHIYSKRHFSYYEKAANEINEIVNFNKTWKEYKNGFGNTESEYWIGNEVLHSLTKDRPWEVAVFLDDWDGSQGKAFWKNFRILGEDTRYKAEISGYQQAKSTIGDGLAYHSDIGFSTKDSDNDAYEKLHCAKTYGGGWWFRQCHVSHLTGSHLFPGEEGHQAVHWLPWKKNKSLKSATMMIRPQNFEKTNF